MQQQNPTDPIPQSVRDLVALFDNDLADVRFPDVSREALGELVGKVSALVGDVNAAQEAFEKSQADLTQNQQLLMEMARRGLLYARVFAENNHELLGKLGAINLKASKAPSATSKPRGRPPKSAEDAPAAEKAEPSTGEAQANPETPKHRAHKSKPQPSA